METTIQQRLSNIEALVYSHKSVMTFNETANYTGLSKSHLYKLTSAGRIPCYKPQGKHLYFNKAEIELWLQRNKVKPREEIESEAVNHVMMKEGGR